METHQREPKYNFTHLLTPEEGTEADLSGESSFFLSSLPSAGVSSGRGTGQGRRDTFNLSIGDTATATPLSRGCAGRGGRGSRPVNRFDHCTITRIVVGVRIVTGV